MLLLEVYLQLRDNTVVDIFLLLLQKVVTDSVERIGAQFVVPNQHKQQVKRHSALEVDTFVLSPTHLLALQH